MPSYYVSAINIGGFLLGEADKVITVFSAERGLLRCVAKGARKPGTKMAGRSDTLSVNRLFLSSGRTFEIITQAECLETFPEFRTDLRRMSYGLYYAELTQHFGQGLSEESQMYYDYLLQAMQLQARSKFNNAWLCLEFELGLLDILGYKPELTYCVGCREVLGDYNVSTFHREHGGIVCQNCSLAERRMMAREAGVADGIERDLSWREGSYITPLVWKNLVLACDRRVSEASEEQESFIKLPMEQSIDAARRLIQGYIEHRVGKRMKSLDLLEQMSARS